MEAKTATPNQFILTSIAGVAITTIDGSTALGIGFVPAPPTPRQKTGRVVGIDTKLGVVYGEPILLQDFDLLLLPEATVNFALGITLEIVPSQGSPYFVDLSNTFTDGMVSLAPPTLPSWPYLQIPQGQYLLYRGGVGEFASAGTWTAVLTVGGMSFTFSFAVTPKVVRYA